MGKIKTVNGNEILEDVILWTGKVFSETPVIQLNYNPFDFKELIVELEYNVFAIVPVLADRTNYNVAYGHSTAYLRTGYVKVDITTSSIKVLNHYIAHQFNASHPDDSAMNIIRIIGRY